MNIRTIGLIGSGHIGTVVARLSIAAGYQVVLSNSRGAASLTELVRNLGPMARATTAPEAARAGDIVVVAVPLKAYDNLPVDALDGKIVIDANNYYPERDGIVETIRDGLQSTSELLQQRLAGASVVKAFNNIFFRALEALAEPAHKEERSSLPIFGDDPDAKAAVIDYLDTIGYDALDGGDLAESWRTENGKPAYVYPYSVNRDVTQFQHVDRKTLTRLLREAVRGQGEPRTASSPR
ncbi:NADPH-dependent F420 reductase [Aeromicrobium tamlense]|uniref:Pyrroline-5-carboxylate reductase catalytic N-terminal domain-containing protein n=1 Tax=Aeromicrobium tamlense TaxID=375541 RepID=A0ABX2SHL6_9ACTN|nr:NAD(P)-binding domain-containing protein [Aeromicrobium tamlense]NYI38149.1 hypothetical protein [Aeromicrobium tamlense]